MAKYSLHARSGAVYELTPSDGSYVFIGRLRDKTLSQFILDDAIAYIDYLNRKKELPL